MKRAITALVFIIFTITLATIAAGARFSHTKWLSETDPYVQKEKQFKAEFGIDQENDDLLLVINIKKDNSFYSHHTLKKLKSFNNTLASHHLIEESKNILSLNAFETGDSINLKTIDFLLENDTNFSLRALEKRINSNSYYRQYITKDAAFLLFRITLQPCDQCTSVQKFIDDTISHNESWIEEHFVISDSILEKQIQSDTKNATTSLIVKLIIILFVICTIIYASPIYSIIIITTVINSVLSAISLFVITNSTLNSVDSILILLVIIISICDALYVMNCWDHNQKIKKGKNTLKDVIIHSYKPCLLTSITTAFGFATFYISSLEPFRNMALIAIPTILMVFVIIISNMFLLLYLFEPFLKQNATNKSHKKNAIDHALYFLTHFPKKHPHSTLSIFSVIFIASISILILKPLTIESDSLKNLLSHKTQTYINFDTFNDLFGSNSLEINLQGEEEHFYQYKNLQPIQALSQDLQQSNVTSIISINDIVSLPQQQLSDKKQHVQSQRDLSQSLLFIELGQENENSNMLSEVVNFDYSASRIQIRSDDYSLDILDRIKQLSQKHHLKIDTIFGTMGTRDHLNKEILLTLIFGIIATTSCCFILLSRCYSLRFGIIGIVINIMSITLFLALISILNYKISYGSALAIIINIGMMVDFTIHMLYICFKMYKNVNENIDIVQRHISQLIDLIGRPIISIALIMACGNCLFIFSNIKLLHDFGVVSLFMLIISVLLHLILMPVATFNFRILREKPSDFSPNTH